MSLQHLNYVNITDIMKFIDHLKNDKNINSITDENLLILYQLFNQIQNGLLFSQFNQIDLVKRLDIIKKINDGNKDNKDKKDIEEIQEIKELSNNKVNKSNNKSKNEQKKELSVVNSMNTSLDEHIDLSKININKKKISISFSKIVQGIKDKDEDLVLEETVNKDIEKVTTESIKLFNENKEKNTQSKINFKNKEEFSTIINEYTKHIIDIGEESINKNGSPFREITSEVMKYGNKLYEEYNGTFPNAYVAFSQIQYGPLNPKKDGIEPNYNERNLTIYEKYDEELGFKKAQKYFLDKGYKLLDISDPYYKTREYTRNTPYDSKSNITSTRIKIILVNKNYTIKQENIDLWHGLNKLPELKEAAQVKNKNKIAKRQSSKEETEIESKGETQILAKEEKKIPSAEKIVEESIKENNLMINSESETFSLIDDN